MIDRWIAEATECDFKAALEVKKPKSWLKSVSAFANGFGGTLFFGIDDDRNIVGLSDAQADAESISRLIKERITPIPGFVLKPERVDGKNTLALIVDAGRSTPYYYHADGVMEAFMRIGNETVVAPDYIVNELILKGTNRSFDALVSAERKSEYSFTLLAATYRERTGLALEDSDFVSFGLADKSGYLTNAGCLLADQHIVYNSRVFCTRWNGLDKGSIFDDALDDKEYEGNLIYLLQSGCAFVQNNSKVRFEKKARYRVDKPDYSERAVTEALVNALIHRDYIVMGSEVHIDMYDDRLEIYSPGGMFEGKPIQDCVLTEIGSARRNPIIADLFHRMKFMERRGSGIRKIITETEQLPGYDEGKKPSFYSTHSSFFVTLRNVNYHAGNTENKTVDTQKSALTGQNQHIEAEKSAQSEGNQHFDTLLSGLSVNRARKANIQKLHELFDAENCFGRAEIMEETGLTASPASDLVRKMLAAGLIVPVSGQGRGKYKFTV